jgi:hypothetical protein
MADRGFNPQNQLTNMGRPPNAIPRVDLLTGVEKFGRSGLEVLRGQNIRI